MQIKDVLESPMGNIFVVDCDVRINTPKLKCKGVRSIVNEVEILCDHFLI